MDEVDCVVVGAGVVGLAVARALALAGREVVVLEAEAAIGTATSSRNSEVIHAGLYYAPGSWKARLCVHGRELLYAYCASRGVAHRRCGKLIVATEPAQESALRALRQRAEACGVHDLQWLDAAQACSLEPALHCTAALLSASTGIVDSHGLMLSLQGEAEAGGAMLALKSPVQRPAASRWRSAATSRCACTPVPWSTAPACTHRRWRRRSRARHRCRGRTGRAATTSAAPASRPSRG
jgi:L-2-hydroxyglutarate oxidase LhgO